jgi:hypothetical protein
VRAGWLAGAALLAACGDRAPPMQVVPAVPEVPPGIEVRAGDYRVRMIGERDGPDLLRVQRLEIRHADAEASSPPVQLIEGLATETPSTPDFPGLEALDMNFDGHADLRLIEFRPAGPNVPYLNWLYHPAQARFIASPTLDALPSAVFLPDKGEVHVPWRDGATRSGVDVYRWQDGQLIKVPPPD